MTDWRAFSLNGAVDPKYDPAIHWEHFESDEAVAKEQLRRIVLLEGTFATVAQTLKRCRDSRPCRSVACAFCGTKFHRHFTATALEAMEAHDIVYMVTYAPDPEYPPKFPVVFDPAKLKERFIRRLERACGSETDIAVIGFIEDSVNRKLRTLVPHVHAIVAGATREQLISANPKQDAERLIYRPWEVSKKPVPDAERVKTFTYLTKVIGSQKQFPIYKSRRSMIQIARAAKIVPASINLHAQQLASLYEFFHTDLVIFRGLPKQFSDRFRAMPLKDRQKAGYRQELKTLPERKPRKRKRAPRIYDRVKPLMT